MKTFLNYTVLSVLFFLTACQQPTDQPSSNEVRIGITSEPDALNPVTYKTIDAQIITSHLFHKLIDIDFSSLELVPVLAENLPDIQPQGDSLYLLSYQIKPEARWDDGKPITAEDVLFSMKAGILPGVSNEGRKGYLKGILDIIPDPENPQHLTFKCKPGMRMEYATGAELGILPMHLYDPDSLLYNISFNNLVHDQLDSNRRKNAAEWAEQFGSARYQRNPAGVNGSGPYRLKKWIADQRIVLEKKEDYWATDIAANHSYFDQFPSTISYFVLTDATAIIRAAENGQIDAAPVSHSGDFLSLQADSNFNKDFQLLLAPELSTNVIIMNACLPELSSVKTRKALAHLFDAEQYITSVQKSTGKRISGPLHPAKSAYHEIEPYFFNLEKAKTLLAEDGWQDSDNDGILDKTIAGKKVDLELNYKFNTGNEGRKNAGLLFKEWARPAGVKINVLGEEWLVFIQNMMAHNFELAFFTWTDEHAPTDPAPLYHSRSIDNGYNFGCFRSERADALMDQLAVTVSASDRKDIWRELQEIFHDEMAAIYLSTNDARFFISRKFAPVSPSALSPGYRAGSLQLQKER